MPKHSGPIRVLIAEDHHIAAVGLRAILEHAPDIVVLPEVLTSGVFLVENVSGLKPDVLCLDMRMPDFMPIPAIRQIKSLPSPPKILIISSLKQAHLIQDACAAGADGYFLKGEANDLNIIAAIRNVMNDAMAYHGEAQNLLTQYRTLPPEITDLQYTVLELLDQNKTTKEMAQLLGSSSNAIHQAYKRLRKTLGVSSTLALAAEAKRRGILPPDDNY